MIKKIIIAEIEHIKKDYKFHEVFLDSDKRRSSLLIPDEYVKKIWKIIYATYILFLETW